MKRPAPYLLAALLLCLPATAGMIGGFAPGDKAKDVRKKIMKSAELEPLDGKSSAKPEENCRLKETIAGQVWVAEFEFDKRSKGLTQVIFIGSHEIKPAQAETLLKSFYVYTSNQLCEHYGLGDPMNTPGFGKPATLKARTMHPLHAYQGKEGVYTIGLWKDKKGDFRICFTLQPVSNTAMGSSVSTNSTGTDAEWQNIPLFETTPEGKAFLLKSGLAGALTGEAEVADDEVDMPDEGEENIHEHSADEDEGGVADEPAVEPADEGNAEPQPAKVAGKNLPQAEQDVLNALLRIEEGKNKEGMDLLIAAGKEGNGRALYELASSLHEGKYGVTANPERAMNAFRKAAEAGFALAMVHFGAERPAALKELGISEEEGQKLLDATLEGAKGGSPSARFNLAVMLRYGYGIRKDVPKAVEIMQQLEKEGDPTAAKYAKDWQP